jgi:hypothetical protein
MGGATVRPTVTIVTPTMPDREGILLSRCIPSVQRQIFSGIIEHVIVSDYNPGLEQRIREHLFETEGNHYPHKRWVTVVQINDTWKNELTMRCRGNAPWRHGSMMAHGDFVGFLGDDDEYLPDHVRVCTTTMDVEHTDFTVSQVAFYGHGTYAITVGDASFAHGHLDATGVMCRRENLRISNCEIAPLDEPHANAGDWRMVRDWRAAGLKGSFVPAVTANHHDGWLVNYQ